MDLSRYRLAAAAATAMLLTNTASATTTMQAGAWHRSTKVELASPVLAKLLGAALQSDVCISPAIAQRGPLAIALVEDGPDCVTTNVRLTDGAFTATRTCRDKQGARTVYALNGRFGPGSIAMEEGSRTASGAPLNAHADLRWTGPCKASTPQPDQ